MTFCRRIAGLSFLISLSIQAEKLSLQTFAGLVAGHFQSVDPQAQPIQNSDDWKRALPASLSTQRWDRNHPTIDMMDAFRVSISKDPANFYPSGQNVLYAFGGPDVFYPLSLFPSFKRLVIIGREDIKALPQVDENDASQILSLLKDVGTATRDLLSMTSFSITSKMKEQITNSVGMATILVAGLASEGFRLQNVIFYSDVFCEEGDGACSLVSLPSDFADLKKDTRLLGFKIIVDRGVEAPSREIFYFDQDLADSPEQFRHPNFFRYLHQQRFDTSFFKAASYLTQLPSFSQISEIALNSEYVVQSDCGLPFASCLSHPNWEIQLYGNYTQRDPITFDYVSDQVDLKKAYEVTRSGRSRRYLNAQWRGEVQINGTSIAYDYAGVQPRVQMSNFMIARRGSQTFPR